MYRPANCRMLLHSSSACSRIALFSMHRTKHAVAGASSHDRPLLRGATARGTDDGRVGASVAARETVAVQRANRLAGRSGQPGVERIVAGGLVAQALVEKALHFVDVAAGAERYVEPAAIRARRRAASRRAGRCSARTRRRHGRRRTRRRVPCARARARVLRRSTCRPARAAIARLRADCARDDVGRPVARCGERAMPQRREHADARDPSCDEVAALVLGGKQRARVRDELVDEFAGVGQRRIDMAPVAAECRIARTLRSSTASGSQNPLGLTPSFAGFSFAGRNAPQRLSTRAIADVPLRCMPSTTSAVLPRLHAPPASRGAAVRPAPYATHRPATRSIGTARARPGRRERAVSGAACGSRGSKDRDRCARRARLRARGRGSRRTRDRHPASRRSSTPRSCCPHGPDRSRAAARRRPVPRLPRHAGRNPSRGCSGSREIRRATGKIALDEQVAARHRDVVLDEREARRLRAQEIALLLQDVDGAVSRRRVRSAERAGDERESPRTRAARRSRPPEPRCARARSSRRN